MVDLVTFKRAVILAHFAGRAEMGFPVRPAFF